MQLVLLGFTAPPPPSPLTAYLDHRAQTCGPRTLALYRHILSRVERQLGGRPPDAASVAAYLRQYRAAAPDTQRNIYRALKAYCRWLVDAGHLAADPFAGPLGVARPRLPRRRRATSTEADILALLTAAAPRAGQRRRWAADGPRAREQPQSRALVLLLIDSAMRAEEVCRLTCGQARAERLVILGKGGHQDRAYIAEPTRRANPRPRRRPAGTTRRCSATGRAGACSVAALRGILERLARRAGVTLPAAAAAQLSPLCSSTMGTFRRARSHHSANDAACEHRDHVDIHKWSSRGRCRRGAPACQSNSWTSGESRKSITRDPLAWLQGRQSGWRLSIVLAPPLLSGITWSIDSRSVVPQQRHRWP
jgi:integrase